MVSQFMGVSPGVKRISVLLSTTRRKPWTFRLDLQVEGQYGLGLVSQRGTTSCSFRMVVTVHRPRMVRPERMVREECLNPPST